MDSSRRAALRFGASLALLPLGGCARLGENDDEASVDLTVLNRSDVERTVEVTVESDGETVFEESYTLPAPDSGVGSASETDVLGAGPFTVLASNGHVTREFQYRSTCEGVEDIDDEIFVTVESDAQLEISGTYCDK